MQSWHQVVLLWLAFAGSHMLLSHGAIRSGLIKRLGGGPFMGLYSLVALGIFVPLVMVYIDNKHQGPLLWNLITIPGVKHLAMLLALVGIAGVVATYSQPPPTGIIPTKSNAPYGLSRITRHPLFMSLGLWGLSHCIINGYASDVAFFGGFAVFALIGCAHQDMRKRNNPDFDQFFAYTGFLPFAAQLAGKGRVVWGELPWLGLLLGAVAGVALYAAHGWLFY